jgi:hypothetical protein
LFEGGFEVFDDFLRGNVGVRQVVGLLEAFVSKQEDLEAALVAVMSSSQFTSPLR